MRRAKTWVMSLFLVLTFPLLVRGETEVCLECHAGQGQWVPAPDIARFWYGREPFQDGGHGDGDHLPGLQCTGTFGCHEMTGAALHNNGILERLASPSENTFHLQERLLPPDTNSSWEVAETFNTSCAEACHPVYGVTLCAGNGHALHSDIPFTPRFGYGLTPDDADGSSGRRYVPLPLDSDLSTLAAGDDEDLALCVSCHDPHGTGLNEGTGTRNRMVRLQYQPTGELCEACHGPFVLPEDRDGDGLADHEEEEFYFTDPDDPDSDGDGIEDGAEVALWTDGACPDPFNWDSDGDGLSDCLDPLPCDPGGTASFVAHSLRELQTIVAGLNPSAFTDSDRRNYRRRIMKMLAAAAGTADNAGYSRAIREIDKVLVRLDGSGSPRDWMHPGEDRAFLLDRLGYLTFLLGTV